MLSDSMTGHYSYFYCLFFIRISLKQALVFPFKIAVSALMSPLPFPLATHFLCEREDKKEKINFLEGERKVFSWEAWWLCQRCLAAAAVVEIRGCKE